MTAEFINALPGVFGRHEDYPPDMIGATIVKMGTIPADRVEGGGLVIDYVPNGGGTKRCVLAFNELGMWVETIEPLSV